MSPPVSLGLPVYQGEKYVAQAIQSILDQDYRDFELIITDNASTDRTAEICQAFAIGDERVRYFRNECNLGAGGNFNRAFALSSGTYFKWCAHDDLISPNFLTECTHALDRDPGAVIAYPRLLGIDTNGGSTSYEERALPDMTDWPAAQRFRLLVAAHGCDAAMFGLWRRQTLAKTSLHAPYYGSDCALLAEMALLGRFVRVPEAVLFSRDHPTRSVNLHSSERLVWQDPRSSGLNAFELSRRMRHLVVIAHRHRREAPLHRSLPHLMEWLLQPLHLARLGLEAIGVVSPSLRDRLRAAGLRALKGMDKAAPRPPMET